MATPERCLKTPLTRRIENASIKKFKCHYIFFNLVKKTFALPKNEQFYCIFNLTSPTNKGKMELQLYWSE